MSIRAHATGHALGSREMAVLLSVASEGSFRRAAMALGVSAAAVSKTVRLAEARLGATVFDRAADGTRPTAAGQVLLQSGRKALSALSAAELEFRASGGLLAGQVRIGCGPFPAPGVARTILPEARRRWPNLKLSIQLGANFELIPLLSKGEIDIALCHIDDLEIPPDVRHSLLQTLNSNILVRPGHPLLATAPVSLPALAPFGLAGFYPFSRFKDWYRCNVGGEVDFTVTGPDFDMLAETVERSDLLLFTSHYLTETLLRTHALVPLRVNGPVFTHEVHLLVSSRSRSPEIESVTRLIQELLVQSEVNTEDGSST